MQTKEYHSEDKSAWPEGVWKEEPDKIQWPDPTTGLPCLIVRGPSGALCGYVGVNETHPWHGKSYTTPVGECTEDCMIGDEAGHYTHNIASRIDVHGGLTFSDRCADIADESRHICHVPGPTDSDHVWWFGFDCAHAGDLSPRFVAEFGPLWLFEVYRDIDYVRQQVTQLAQQLDAVRTNDA